MPAEFPGMDFFPLGIDIGDVQASCWDAQDEIARRMESVLSSLAEPLAKADAETETAIVRLVRRMQSAIKRGCKPLDDTINALFQQLLQPVVGAINLIDQQILAVQQGVRAGQLPGQQLPVGAWWFDDSDSGTISVRFVPGSSRPPPWTGDWKGPYETKQGAERGWMQRHTRNPVAPHGSPPHGALPGGPTGLAPRQPTTPPATPPPLPSPGVSPPGGIPPRPPAPPSAPPPPPQFPRGLQPRQQPGLPGGGGPTIGQTGGSVTTVSGSDSNGSTTQIVDTVENAGGSESSARADVTVIEQPAQIVTATTVRVPPCGIQPDTLSQIVGVVLIPPDWSQGEEAAVDSDCGQAMILSALGRKLSASAVAAAIDANDLGGLLDGLPDDADEVEDLPPWR